MCTAIGKNLLQGGTPQTADDGKPQPIRRATEVPLGDGMADAAKTAILSRRERIEQATRDAGG
jgi:hypothetical protein